MRFSMVFKKYFIAANEQHVLALFVNFKELFVPVFELFSISNYNPSSRKSHHEPVELALQIFYECFIIVNL